MVYPNTGGGGIEELAGVSVEPPPVEPPPEQLSKKKLDMKDKTGKNTNDDGMFFVFMKNRILFNKII